MLYFKFMYLDEYRRMNIMYCENCYLAPPATNMVYVAEGITNNYTLNIKTETDDRNFITQLLYKDVVTF